MLALGRHSFSTPLPAGPCPAGALPNEADDIRVLQRTAIDAMADVAAEKLGVLSGAGSAVDPERKDDR